MTSTFFGLFGMSVVKWPSMRWRRMSCGSLEGLHLAGVVIVEDAARQPRDRNRRVPSSPM